MAILKALHGRARLRRAGRLRAKLLIASLVALLAVPLKISVQNATAGDLSSALTGWELVALTALNLGGLFGWISPVVGGMLANRFGVRPIVAILLFALCGIAVAMLGLPPHIAFPITALATAGLPGALLVCVLTGLRLTLARRRRGPALAACLLVFAFAAPVAHEIWRHVHGTLRGAPVSPAVALSLVAACVAVALVWYLSMPKDNPEAGLILRAYRPIPAGVHVRVFGRADLWRVIPVLICAGTVQSFGLGRFNISLGLLVDGGFETIDLLLVAVVPAAFLIFAAWSDRSLKRSGSRAPRQPFLVFGFVAAGIAPLLAAAFPGKATVLLAIGAAGLGAVQLANLLPVDVAPRPSAWRFIGTALTLSYVARAILEPGVLFVGNGSRPAVICGLALAGAAFFAWMSAGLKMTDDSDRDQRAANIF